MADNYKESVVQARAQDPKKFGSMRETIWNERNGVGGARPEPTEWKWEGQDGREAYAYPRAVPGNWFWMMDNSLPDPSSPNGGTVATNISPHTILMGCRSLDFQGVHQMSL